MGIVKDMKDVQTGQAGTAVQSASPTEASPAAVQADNSAQATQSVSRAMPAEGVPVSRRGG